MVPWWYIQLDGSMKHQIAFSTSLCKTIGLSKKKTDAIVAFAVNLLILGYHGCRHVTTASSVVEIEGTFISPHPMSWSESLSFSTCDKKICRNYFPCRGNSGLVLNTPQMTALHTVAPPGVFFFWQFDFGGDMFFFPCWPVFPIGRLKLNVYRCSNYPLLAARARTC